MSRETAGPPEESPIEEVRLASEEHEIPAPPAPSALAGGVAPVAEETEVSVPAARDKKMDLVVFQVGEGTYAFRLVNVREIVRLEGLRSIPHASEHVVGVCSLRGHVLPVIDLRSCFRMPRKTHDEDTKMIVVEVQGDLAGMVTDRVLEVTGVEESEVMAPPSVLGNHGEGFVTGIVMRDGRILMVLDAEKLIRVQSADPGFEGNQGHKVQAADHEPARSGGQGRQEKIVAFRIDDGEYGIAIDRVREIHHVDRIVSVPGMPGFVSGMAGLRGEMIPLVDMRALFGIAGDSRHPPSKFLVVERDKERIGLLVDAVSEVLGVSEERFKAASRLLEAESQKRFVDRICKLDDGNRHVMMVNVNAVFDEVKG